MTNTALEKTEDREKHLGITIDQIVSLKLKNPALELKQAAVILGCSIPNITQHLARYGTKWSSLVDSVKSFKEQRADLLALTQRNALAELSPDKLQTASAKDLAIVFGTLYDKERLERGQSTSNHAVSLLSAAIEAADEPFELIADEPPGIFD